MRTPSERLLSSTQVASTTEVRRSGEKVLLNLYQTGLARIEEDVLRTGLVPIGDVMIRITVEQWCDSGMD